MTRLAMPLNPDLPVFARAAVSLDVEEFQKFIRHHRRLEKMTGEMALI